MKTKKLKMKTAGVIGGLGPETTASFFLEVISSCFKTNKINRPPMLIFNVPMNFDIEKEIIVNDKGIKHMLPFLIDAVEHLEKGGADFIVIPCNTAHIFIEEVRQSVNIPVLSIIEETASFLAKNQVENIGLLGTASTIGNKLFDEEFENHGVKINLPDKASQLKIGLIINRLVNDRQTRRDKEELKNIINGISTKADCILLACTDLQLLVSKHRNLKIFDTMHILADATVREILKGGD